MPLYSAHELQHNNNVNKHLFHGECLEEWFKQTKKKERNCPLCNQPLSGLILSSLTGIRPYKALNASFWAASMALNYEKVELILREADSTSWVLSDDLIDTVYAHAISHDRQELLKLLDEFCGKQTFPCIAYGINHKHLMNMDNAVRTDPQKALQFALLMDNQPVLKRALEHTTFQMETDFWYLQHAVIEKRRMALLKAILAKSNLWTSLRIRYKLWKLVREHKRMEQGN